ncbi:hypothetical protein [Streptomyces luteolus]|uniref:Uncharacterized protein n=1 Tax=Streptomyces luteolus TaxID=3043615 RepID=A0ABT6SST6_9ACTN|nr:hypothetical protein [Streptomyces sp. B-S-A12]MDI3418669.1 hypothetical protein [Streptomyces sp. B-S-A12]
MRSPTRGKYRGLGEGAATREGAARQLTSTAAALRWLRQAVLDTATRLRDTGRVQEALHVIDLLALAPGDDPHVVRARKLKGDLCALRKEEISSYVSRSCYEAGV